MIGGQRKCLRAGQPCAKKNEAGYRRHGFTCVNGHLRKRTAAPPPAPTPPPPPPPPPAQPGHFHGLTSQSETFDFDVTADGSHITALVVGGVNQGCNPPAHIAGNRLDAGSSVFTLGADGTLGIDATFESTVDDDPSTDHITIAGRVTGSAGTGTLRLTTAFTSQGTAYTCESGSLTWSVTRTG